MRQFKIKIQILIAFFQTQFMLTNFFFLTLKKPQEYFEEFV